MPHRTQGTREINLLGRESRDSPLTNSSRPKNEYARGTGSKVGLTSNMQAAAHAEVNEQLFSALLGKTSDLDWFMFETKVRQIILELVEPIKSKNDLMMAKEEHQFAELEVIQRRLDEVEYVVQKVQTQNNDFSSIKNETDKFTAKMSRNFE